MSPHRPPFTKNKKKINKLLQTINTSRAKALGLQTLLLAELLHNQQMGFVRRNCLTSPTVILFDESVFPDKSSPLNNVLRSSDFLPILYQILASSLSPGFGFFYLRAPGLSDPETFDFGKLGVTESEKNRRSDKFAQFTHMGSLGLGVRIRLRG